jgi:nucleoside-diphosphate-sugar epimerase
VRALVTGGTGYLGKHLVRRLNAEGWDAHVIVRPSKHILGVKCHVYDGTLGSIQKAVSTKPDVVFHLAALVLVEHKPDDLAGLIQSNITLGTQILESIQGSKTKFINTGTYWQHFGDEPYNPVNLYAATKQAFQDILKFYTEKGQEAVTLKVFDVYGPNDQRPKLLNQLFIAAQTGKHIQLTPGLQFIDLVYVDDVVDGFMKAASMKMEGHQYNLRTHSLHSIRNVVETYQRVLGQTIPVQWGAKPYRPREIMKPPELGETLPGWKARTSLEEGLGRIAYWLRNAA